MPKLVASKRFERDLKKLLRKNPQIESKIEKTLEFLLEDPQHPSLCLHKLSGLGDNYSVSVDMNIRIILSFAEEKIYLLRIGTHDEVY